MTAGPASLTLLLRILRKRRAGIGPDRGGERGRLEDAAIPEWVDFQAVPGLSTEVRERLSGVRPRSLGQAARIPGITPAAVSLLAVHIRAGHARSATSAS